jgi:hypothetical protein
MVSKDLIDLINNYASHFAMQVGGHSAMGHYDMSTHAEQASILILNAVFDLELKNVNQDKRNHPAIDLIDEKKGVAFQVTATATPLKVASTLQKFISNNLHERYHTLYIYILTEKRSKYNTSKIRNIVKDKFNFDVGIHIVDYKDIMRRISFITSVEVLSKLARLYEQLSTPLIEFQFLQNTSKYSFKRSLSYIDHVKNELEDIIGHKNVNKIPELSESFNNISALENDLQDKEKELQEYRDADDGHKKGKALQNILDRAYVKAQDEYNDIRRAIELEKETVNALSLNIRRQKEFLDQIDYEMASERMHEARRLFEAGEYAMVNTLLNYKGRQDYISKKLEERERQSTELKSLANEEVLLALNKLQKQDWHLYIQQIKTHFEQSIDLGGYGVNSFQYSYFLEDINEKDQAVDILYQTLAHLPEKETENRAALWERLGNLLKDSNKEEALKAFTQAVFIYGQLFNEDRDSYEFSLAEALFECSSLYIQQSSLEHARDSLEQALMIVGTLNKRADTNMQKLTYVILMALGSLHQSLGNDDETASYQGMALYMGAVISLDNPQKELFALLEAVRRFRMLMGEKKEGPHSDVIYNYALRHFTRIQRWQSQEDAFNTAKALEKLGHYLLVEKEFVGAGICFQGALKIFRTLNKKGYSCLAEISDSLKWVGSIYMTQNNVKARKKVLLEALSIRKQLSENEPVENLSKVASLLNELYDNSFIGVPSSQYYKAYPFFEEALAIHKNLDEKYLHPNFEQWLQLLQHKSIFLSRGLDKTDAIIWYQELVHLLDRIPSSLIELYKEKIQIAIHEVGQVLLKNTDADDALFLRIAKDIINARKVLFKQDPEKYSTHLLCALLDIGNKLAEAKQWQEACPYLQEAVNMIQEFIKKDPDKYHKAAVMPTLKLAFVYSKLTNYVHSVNLYTDLYNYFEVRLSENAQHLTVMVSIMVLLTEVLLTCGQKGKAADYIAKAMKYLPDINDLKEQQRLKALFEELENEYFLDK